MSGYKLSNVAGFGGKLNCKMQVCLFIEKGRGVFSAPFHSVQEISS